MTVLVDVQFAIDDDTAPGKHEVETWIARAFEAAGPEAHGEVSVRVVDTDEIRGLNARYRGKDTSTNVLSFPTTGILGLPADTPRPLGDIVVCASVVRDEAAEQGKAVADHWAHMLVHGTLHLLGFDHETETEAAAMESLEKRILSGHGVGDPYGAPGENC